MSDCVVCGTFQDFGRVRDMWIYDDDLVLLGHVAPTPNTDDGYPGHLLLVPKRHVTTPSGLTQPEAQAIGVWFSRGCQLLESTLGAEHVYMQRLGDGWAHLHLHFVARYPNTPKEYRGLNVRDWSGVPRYDWSGTAAVAAKLREAAAAFSRSA